MRNISETVVEKSKHILFWTTFFSENRTVYEIRWENIVERGRSQMPIWCMRIAGWIPKATNTHSEYVIRTDFPWEKWLNERASILRYA